LELKISAFRVARSHVKITVPLVAGAAISGVFAGVGLVSAPTANATCASFFGIGNSADCTSTIFSGAIAIGNGAVAHADGLFGAAFVVGSNSSASIGSGTILNFATSLFGDNNVVAATGGLANWATNIGGNNNTVTTQGSLSNTATNLFGSNNTVTTQDGYLNWARNILGDANTLKIQGGYANQARNLLGTNNTATIQAGYGDFARTLFGTGNSVTTIGGYLDTATSLFGSDNTITAQGGYLNSARHIGGSGNTLTTGGLGSNRNFGLNLFSSGNDLTTGAQGNLNAVINAGGGDNTISAGDPGNLNAGFNFFGTGNNVAAGPGPLALAGSLLRDGQTITKTNPGIAINDFRVGGAAATRTESSTAPKAAQAGPGKKNADRGRKAANAAGAASGSVKGKS
jgi:hypothetical protein